MGRAAKSGSRVPHLQRRHGTYHLRVRVPDDLRVRIGLSEVRRSLHVHTFAAARPLALKYAARVMEVFEMAKATDLTKERIRSLIQDRFEDLRQEVDGGYNYESADRDQERDYQAHLAEEAITDIRTQQETGDFRYPVVGEVLQLLQRAGISLADVTPDALDDLSIGLSRALIEQDRLF